MLFFSMDIRTYLEKSGISQSAFAEMAGVTQGMVWQWLKGLRPVSPTACVAIEKATGKAISRKDLRPSDWNKIWPDLLDEREEKERSHI